MRRNKQCSAALQRWPAHRPSSTFVTPRYFVYEANGGMIAAAFVTAILLEKKRLKLKSSRATRSKPLSARPQQRP